MTHRILLALRSLEFRGFDGAPREELARVGPDSTDGGQGDAFASLITGDALGARIER